MVHGDVGALGRRDAIANPPCSLSCAALASSNSLPATSKVPAHSLSSHSLFSRSHISCRTSQEARLTCRTICRDYCNNTAVHGFRYFFEKNRSTYERYFLFSRAFWVVAVVLCFSTAFYLISRIWIKWETTPVIVTFADNPTAAWDIPFPTVTICPSTKTKQSLFNYTRTQHRVLDNIATDEETEKFRALSLVCVPETTGGGTLNDSALQFLREVAPTFDEVMVECYWQHIVIGNCSKYFREIISEEGLCFQFNSLGPRELFAADTLQAQEDDVGPISSGWSEEVGYYTDNLSVKRFYPLRQLFTGAYSGLRIILRSYDKDMDYVCRGCEQGFRVYLHSPAQQPWASGHQLALPLNTSVQIRTRPVLMQTSEGLRSYHPARRLCFFASERKLRLFLNYSQENCIYECFANLTLKKCGCTPLGVPRLANTTVCSVISECGIETYNFLDEVETRLPFESPIPTECGCLPACTSLRYDADASIFDFPWIKEKQSRRKAFSNEGISLCQLSVYFDSLQFIASRRSELYGHTDFIANFGGLLGLFTGFSIISLVEIGYYVSLRLWCDVKRRAAQRRLRGGDR